MSSKLRAPANAVLLEKIKSLKTLPDTIVSASLVNSEWDDKKFEVFRERAAPHFVKRIDNQAIAKVALKYIATYLGVDEMSQDSHVQTIFTLLAHLRIEDEYPFPQGKKNPITIETAVKKVERFVFPEGGTEMKIAEVTISQKDVANFYEAVYDLCNSMNESDQLKGISIAGFIALTMLRAFRKEIFSLITHIPIRGTSSYQNLFKYEFSFRFPPPSSKYISDFSVQIPQSGITATNILAYCVCAWVCTKDQTTPLGKYGRAMLKAGCMLSLSENGLGALAWTFKAIKALSTSPSDYLQALMLDCSLESQANKVGSFIYNETKGDTWPFCRLFDETALCDLSNAGCPELSIIGALISVRDSGAIEDMPQFKNIAASVKAMVPTALAIEKVLKPNEPTSAVTDIGVKVIDARAQFRGKQNMTKRRGLQTGKNLLVPRARIHAHTPDQDEEEEEEEYENDSEDDGNNDEQQEESSMMMLP